jgi:hypothetical protein
VKNPTLSELRQELDRERKRLPRWMRWLLWTGGIIACWSLLGFFAAPPILRGQLEKRLSVQLNRRVAIGKVGLNPLTFSLKIESFSVAEPAGGEFIGWQRLFVDFDTFSFLLREWRFQEIVLDGFSGKVAVAADGRLNFADLLKALNAPSAAPQAAKKTWPLLVRRLAITHARLSYNDASRGEPFATEIGPTTVSLLNFYTGGPKQAPGEFTATTESGETFAWRGALSFAPLRSNGDVTLGKIALKKYAPYYSNQLRFDIRGGLLDVALHYDFAVDDGKPSLRVSNGRVALDSLKIGKRGNADPSVVLNQVELTGLAATYPKISVEVARMVVSGGSVAVQRGSEGIDLINLLMPVGVEAPPAVALPPLQPPASSAPIDAKVTEISIRDLDVTIEDLTTPRPARHELTELTCDLRGFSLTSLSSPMPFGFKAKLAPEGIIHAAGTIALAPMKAELALELTAISLSGLSPYAESFANLRIAKGQLTTALNVRLELPPGAAPIVSAQGDVSVEDFDASDATSVDEIVGWNSLAMKGLEYSSDPSKLMIGDLNWIEPACHLIMNPDGTLNFSVALRSPGAAAPDVAMPNASVKKPDISDSLFVALDRFVLENAAFDFVDRSLQPNVRISLNELSGQVDGLASSDLARATVNLHGKVDGVAPVAISGKINPLSAEAFTDLKVVMKGIELRPVGPYLGKYAGYELSRGSLNVDVKCRVAQGKIDCTNVVTIDQFTLGNATNSPDATTLPVRLAVALLRDTAGRIVLDVPVQGSLADPDIRSGRVIWRVVTNLLVKAATSPFSLIGSMFGGEKGQDLSFLQFAVGELDPQNEDEVRKLDVVAKALLARPTLRLEIVGGFDEVADGPALRERALENEMRGIILADRRLVDPDLTLDQIQLDPLQKMGMVRRFYYKMHPKDAPRRISRAPSIAAAPVAGQRGNLGVFQRKETSVPRPPPVAPKQAPAAEVPPAPGDTIETSPLPPGPKQVSLEEMKARLIENMTIDDDVFIQLASNRAKAVRDYLVDRGLVPAERISLAAEAPAAPVAKGARVELRLK